MFKKLSLICLGVFSLVSFSSAASVPCARDTWCAISSGQTMEIPVPKNESIECEAIVFDEEGVLDIDQAAPSRPKRSYYHHHDVITAKDETDIKLFRIPANKEEESAVKIHSSFKIFNSGFAEIYCTSNPIYFSDTTPTRHDVN